MPGANDILLARQPDNPLITPALFSAAQDVNFRVASLRDGRKEHADSVSLKKVQMQEEARSNRVREALGIGELVIGGLNAVDRMILAPRREEAAAQVAYDRGLSLEKERQDRLDRRAKEDRDAEIALEEKKTTEGIKRDKALWDLKKADSEAELKVKKAESDENIRQALASATGTNDVDTIADTVNRAHADITAMKSSLNRVAKLKELKDGQRAVKWAISSGEAAAAALERNPEIDGHTKEEGKAMALELRQKILFMKQNEYEIDERLDETQKLYNDFDRVGDMSPAQVAIRGNEFARLDEKTGTKTAYEKVEILGALRDVKTMKTMIAIGEIDADDREVEELVKAEVRLEKAYTQAQKTADAKQSERDNSDAAKQKDAELSKEVSAFLEKARGK